MSDRGHSAANWPGRNATKSTAEKCEHSQKCMRHNPVTNADQQFWQSSCWRSC